MKEITIKLKTGECISLLLKFNETVRVFYLNKKKLDKFIGKYPINFDKNLEPYIILVDNIDSEDFCIFDEEKEMEYEKFYYNLFDIIKYYKFYN